MTAKNLDEDLGSSPVTRLRHWAEVQPGKLALRFLRNGEEETARLTFGELDRQVRAVAAYLQRNTERGDRVVLGLPSAQEFVAAFLGCLYAGRIAVPVQAPRPRRETERVGQIIVNAEPVLALAHRGIVDQIDELADGSPLGAVPWLDVDGAQADPDAWQDPGPDGEEIAFLQYTSGSTGHPKGVAVSHRNLVVNERAIERVAGLDEQRMVGWLPLTHDMGLLGMMLQGLFSGGSCTLMPPLSFLQQPMRWLRALSRYRGNISPAPNFAYQLCVDRADPAEIERLDLSSWQVAFCGAEPVRKATLDRFAETFAPSGFRAESLVPCYGLAEATLMVSAGPRENPTATHRVRRADGALRSVVGVGRITEELEALIVDPETRTLCEDGEIGELWLAGESVAQGYWRAPEASAEIFAARPVGHSRAPGRFLRTGDLGLIADGELFITGRLKDLMVIDGANYHPEDLEGTLSARLPKTVVDDCAVFSVEIDERERVVAAVEVARKCPLAPEEIDRDVREALADRHPVPVHSVVLLGRRHLPRTPSGKVQRHRCRDLFLSGAWKDKAPFRVRQMSG